MFCLPVPHDKFETKTPWVIIGIAVVDAVLLVPALRPGAQPFLAQYGFTPAYATMLTFFTGIFLHVGFWHYAGNMLFFWMFGRKVEATLGHGEFALAYLLCGCGGQLLYWVLDLHSTVPCVGASGAISGIAGLYVVMYPKDRFDLQIYFGWWRVKTIESNARVAVGVWIGEQFVLALITAMVSFSSIAFWAHIGGFVAGAGIGLLYMAVVPAGEMPTFKEIQVPLKDEIAQSNELVGLNLSPTPKRIDESQAESV